MPVAGGTVSFDNRFAANAKCGSFNEEPRDPALGRSVPRDREIPRWVGKGFTVLDGVLVGIIAVSLWFCLR